MRFLSRLLSRLLTAVVRVLPVHLVRKLLLGFCQLFCIIAQGAHRTFERGPLEHLCAFFELLTHLLLLRGQLLHRLLRFGATQSFGAFFERLQLLLHFRRHRFAQHLLHIAHACRQRRVECACILEALFELLGTRAQRIDFGAELLLIAP